MKTYVILLVGLSICALTACNFDKLPEPVVSDICETLQPVYEGQIESIIEQSCSYSGCHDGAAATNYTTYQNMISNLENGNISTRVLNVRDMPPSYTPDGKAKELKADELELIECWIANEFPEN